MYLEMRHIEKHFGRYHAARDVSFGIEKGRLVALLGPSGGGKTTLLRMIAGLETPDSGDILIDGRRMTDVAPSRRGIGFVFQNYALFRYMTVAGNIGFGLKVQKQPKAAVRARVAELVELTGLSGLEKRYPGELSGGQRQRVAFARALAPSPQILLLDEPFAAIDAKVRRELRAWLKEMIARLGVTAIFVTHDQDEAVEIADQIFIVNEGRIEQAGSPVEIYKSPQTPFVARFIGSSTALPAYERLRGFHAIPGAESAIVRPEFIEAFKPDNQKFAKLDAAAESGVITNIAFRGNSLEVELSVCGMRMLMNRSLERRPICVGETMRVLIYKLYVFENGRAHLLENEALAGVQVD